MKPLEKLQYLKQSSSDRQTDGLDDDTIQKFLARDPRLAVAIDEAYDEAQIVNTEFPELNQKAESEQVFELQKQFVNFYAKEAINPYIPLAARGPWIITNHGAVVHDSGGYGMLGFGHHPEAIVAAMGKPHVMANIMTASFWHSRVTQVLNKEIGQNRTEKPYSHYLCLNSGSEAVSVATRICDINAKIQSQGRKIQFLALEGGFHGRTCRPAQASDSSKGPYIKYLASYQNRDFLQVVPPNDCEALEKAFKKAAAENIFYEAMMMEPVMGEGNPGLAISPEFYALARKLTRAHKTLLMVDSIQAGIRAHGYLSIVDYPGFSNLDAPDLESYSKAVNAGQYPLSILALNQSSAELYRTGIYGNTMTANPRALAVACAVVQSLTPSLRENIVAQGRYFLKKLGEIAQKFPDLVTKVQGTGLLFSIAINPNKAKVEGKNGMETYLRKHGIGVIHGGTNALRFTPVFDISAAEVDMIGDKLSKCFTYFSESG